MHIKRLLASILFLLALYPYKAISSGLELNAAFVNTENLPAKNINTENMLPSFKALTTTKLNKLVHVVFFVKGYGTDKNGKTNLELDLKIVSPSNKLLYEKEKFSIIKIQRENRKFIVIEQILDFMIESGDELGKYTVSSRVFDNISRDAKVKNISIQVTE